MTRQFLLGVLVIAWAISESSAQQARVVMNQVRVGGPLGMGVDETELETMMKMEVDLIKRLTGIPDSAVKKLEVAAAAAVKSAMKKAPQPQIGGFPFAPQPAPAAADSLSDEDAERKQKAAEDDKAKVLAPGALPAMVAINVDTIKKEEIWKKTVANVLNEEQTNSYQKHLNERTARERYLAVQNQISKLDSYLLLTEQQRDSLTKLVELEQADQLYDQRMKNEAAAGMGNIFVIFAGGQIKPLSLDKLTEILNPAQLVEYKRQQDKLAQGPLGQIPGMQPPKKASVGSEEAVEFAIGAHVNLSENRLVVKSINPDSMSARAGLQVGDVIDAINGSPVDTLVQLKRSLAKLNKSWRMQVRRQGELIELEFVE